MHVALGGRSQGRGSTRSDRRSWRPGSLPCSTAASVVVTRTRKGAELTDDIRAGI